MAGSSPAMTADYVLHQPKLTETHHDQSSRSLIANLLHFGMTIVGLNHGRDDL
jgi:hypothetical protein